jgi:hypothetical protein
MMSSPTRTGGKVMGKTIGDMGNGQPISMVAYRDEGGGSTFHHQCGTWGVGQ